MATKKTTKSTTKSAPKAKAPKAKAATKTAKAPKGEKAAASTAPRHPKARLTAAHGSKKDLAKSLASVIARGDQNAGDLESQLATASNQQLLRLSRVVDTMKKKWGSRDKLIAAIGTAQNKSKDKDYLAKLETYSLPQLVDLATAAQRSANA
ncbi:MAG: hypothetical protein AB7O24_21415 [Kofleriaceae bacterium]